MLAAYKNPKNTEASATFLLDHIDSLDFIRLLDNGDYQFVDKVLSKAGYHLDTKLFMHDDMKNVFGALAYLHAYPKISTFLYISDTTYDAHFVYQFMSLALLLDMQVPAIQSL